MQEASSGLTVPIFFQFLQLYKKGVLRILHPLAGSFGSFGKW